jgi:dynein heavy chain
MLCLLSSFALVFSSLQTEFREDLKGLTRQAGCANRPTVFLFDETQIVMETFLEDVNNILTSGEVRE